MREAADYIRSDNGPEFMAKEIRRWLASQDVQTLYIEPGSPWENGYRESFISRFGHELLNRELFCSLKEAKRVVEDWRLEYNHKRPHSSLDYTAPAAFAAACIVSASPQQ